MGDGSCVGEEKRREYIEGRGGGERGENWYVCVWQCMHGYIEVYSMVTGVVYI